MQGQISTKRRNRRAKADNGYVSHNKIQLVRGGRPYFDQLLGLIREAEYTIMLQVYIFDDDETGREVAAALREAAGRKVEVYLMADGYASQGLTKRFIRELEDAGVHFRFFEPLFRSRHSYFGRRLHHKVVVVDNHFAMVGGINIANHYNDVLEQPGWLDFAVRVEGTIVKELCRICQNLWHGYFPDEKISRCRDHHPTLHIPQDEDCQLRVRRNDWITKKNQISKSYIEMLRKADQEILMMSGYFLPGPVMRRNMKKASRRGVKIRLVLAGISDVMVAKNAERFMYHWLFKNQIEVYEYKPCVLHGKLAVYDRVWATVGSYNLNIISAYASIELNIDINNAGFASGLQDCLEQIISRDCEQITRESFIHRRGVFLRVWDRICYGFIRFLFYLFTFSFKQRDN